jgi:hypothetical protein
LLDLDQGMAPDAGAIPLSIERPRQEAESVASPAPAFANSTEPLRAPASAPQPSSSIASLQHAGLGVKQVVLLVVTMVFIAVAVSAAVTLYVTRGSRPPAAQTTQP